MEQSVIRIGHHISCAVTDSIVDVASNVPGVAILKAINLSLCFVTGNCLKGRDWLLFARTSSPVRYDHVVIYDL